MSYQYHSSRARPIEWLPQTVGYRFTGILQDGKTVACRIVLVDGALRPCHEGKPVELRSWKE